MQMRLVVHLGDKVGLQTGRDRKLDQNIARDPMTPNTVCYVTTVRIIVDAKINQILDSEFASLT